MLKFTVRGFEGAAGPPIIPSGRVHGTLANAWYNLSFLSSLNNNVQPTKKYKLVVSRFLTSILTAPVGNWIEIRTNISSTHSVRNNLGAAILADGSVEFEDTLLNAPISYYLDALGADIPTIHYVNENVENAVGIEISNINQFQNMILNVHLINVDRTDLAFAVGGVVGSEGYVLELTLLPIN